MKTDEYLFGESKPLSIPQEVIEDRITKLKTNLNKLLEVALEKRDFKRVNDILKAINFWKKINRSELWN